MRHYEIVILIHPDQSKQVDEMVRRYRETIESGGGTVHRYEDWGLRRLEYIIRKIHKAHYVLLNIECNNEILDELKQNFRYNDAVIRQMIIRREEAVTEVSPILKLKQKSEAEEAERKSVRAIGTDQRGKGDGESKMPPAKEAAVSDGVADGATAGNATGAGADAAGEDAK